MFERCRSTVRTLSTRAFAIFLIAQTARGQLHHVELAVGEPGRVGRCSLGARAGQFAHLGSGAQRIAGGTEGPQGRPRGLSRLASGSRSALLGQAPRQIESRSGRLEPGTAALESHDGVLEAAACRRLVTRAGRDPRASALRRCQQRVRTHLVCHGRQLGGVALGPGPVAQRKPRLNEQLEGVRADQLAGRDPDRRAVLHPADPGGHGGRDPAARTCGHPPVRLSRPGVIGPERGRGRGLLRVSNQAIARRAGLGHD